MGPFLFQTSHMRAICTWVSCGERIFVVFRLVAAWVLLGVHSLAYGLPFRVPLNVCAMYGKNILYPSGFCSNCKEISRRENRVLLTGWG